MRWAEIPFWEFIPDLGKSLRNTARVTVPASYNMVKLEYGPGNRYEPVVVGIGNDLAYNYNNFKEAAATSSCDLSGFLTYSQGGWQPKHTETTPKPLETLILQKSFPAARYRGPQPCPDKYGR